MTRRALPLLLVLAACGVGATGRASPAPGAAAGEPPVVVTEGGFAALPDPALRYPDGARVVRVDADGTRTVLSQGLAAAGAPFVHHDGRRLLFVARERSGAPYRVHECAADGSARRVVVDHGTDCVRAAYLPDGRIVYSAALPGVAPAAGLRSPAAVFVADGAGGAGARITFGAGVDTDPTVISDGRVLFASWRPGDTGDTGDTGGGRLGLFTVHPDGTGYAPFHVAAGDAVYPVQQAGGDVRFTLHAGGAAVERIADWDAPLSVAHDADGADGETVALAPRTRPQGHLSSFRPEVGHGTLVCVDARASGATAATRAQIATFGGERVVLGLVDLAGDGSFMARVPVDTPLVIDLFDANGRLVRGEHGPLWVRSNEVRVCVSCHDDVEASPPNRRPLAVRGEAADMTGTAR